MDEHTPAIDPRRTALLVMDYQAGIVGRITDADDRLTRMRAAIDVARQHGIVVGYVRVALTDEEREAVPEHNKSFFTLARQRPAMHADAPETAVHEAVAPPPGDIVVRKQRVGPFSTTDLAEQLAVRGIDTLVLGGISTSSPRCCPTDFLVGTRRTSGRGGPCVVERGHGVGIEVHVAGGDVLGKVLE